MINWKNVNDLKQYFIEVKKTNFTSLHNLAILIPCYGVKKEYVERTLNSVLKQKLEFELIVVYKNFGDFNYDWIKEFVKGHNNVSIYKTENNNLKKASKVYFGSHNINSKYFFVLDADDEIDFGDFDVNKWKLFIDESPDIVLIDKYYKVYKKNKKKLIKTKNYFFNGCSIYKTSAVKKVEKFVDILLPEDVIRFHLVFNANEKAMIKVFEANYYIYYLNIGINNKPLVKKNKVNLKEIEDFYFFLFANLFIYEWQNINFNISYMNLIYTYIFCFGKTHSYFESRKEIKKIEKIFKTSKMNSTLKFNFKVIKNIMFYFFFITTRVFE